MVRRLEQLSGGAISTILAEIHHRDAVAD